MNIQVSDNFKKMTTKAIVAIVLFLVVYLLLLLLAIGLTILCVVGAFYLITIYPSIITFALGLGLASFGFFILGFLFKFIFKKHTFDRSHLTEITAQTQPELFKFIQDIVTEVGTDFPKKIYLSADVNASVFYDSSFWSMFFPIKKNLQIGLGLVNTVTEQEFKAILAHEFGHFSQKSMKVGSYVYNVNQVIFNMLYDNNSFDNIIQKWANASSYFSIFVLVAVQIIEAIQWVLKKMYDFININYMALSREMEFHADEVAANVTGFLPLKESLLRLDLASHSYQAVLSFYEKKLAENKKSENIYPEQNYILRFFANENKLQFKNDLPLVSFQDLNKYNKSKLVIKDQWASHPSTEDRIRHLEQLNIVKETGIQKTANSLFADIESVQIKLTAKLFSFVENSSQMSVLSIDTFKTEYDDNYQKNSFNKIYNGYYDNKNPNYFDVHLLENFTQENSLELLFNKENIEKIYDFIALENDKNILTNIDNKTYSLKTFDYDGQKFNSKEAAVLLPKISIEIDHLKQEISEHDVKIYQYFFSEAQKQNVTHDLKTKYINYFDYDKKYDTKLALYHNLINESAFISTITPIPKIKENLKKLKRLEETLKIEIKNLLDNELCQKELTADIKENFNSLLKEDWMYFLTDRYIDAELEILFKAINNYGYMISREYFLVKQNLLDYQCTLITK